MISEQKKRAREQVLHYFQKIASEENEKNQIKSSSTLEDLINKTDPRKRLLLVVPESIGDIFIISSLLESFRNSYPKNDWCIYFATNPNYFSILNGNVNLDYLIPHHPSMDHEIAMTGQGSNKGIFDAYSFIPALTQKFLSYLTNNNIALNLT